MKKKLLLAGGALLIVIGSTVGVNALSEATLTIDHIPAKQEVVVAEEEATEPQVAGDTTTDQPETDQNETPNSQPSTPQDTSTPPVGENNEPKPEPEPEPTPEPVYVHPRTIVKKGNNISFNYDTSFGHHTRTCEYFLANGQHVKFEQPIDIQCLNVGEIYPE